MRQKIYQIDAFTNWTFGGNPAAVCILNSWLSPELMQKIAQENNLAETAFAVKKMNSMRFAGLPQKWKWTFVDMPL